MTSEQNKIVEVLRTALQMEIDGKIYYLKASQQSKNELGKKLLQSLAAEEDIHRQKFEEIYNAVRNKKAWPETNFKPDKGKRLRTILAAAKEESGSPIRVLTTELDTVQTAIDMEGKTYDFYRGRGKNATYEAERDFYATLAGEEMGHRLILTDYYEYLKDPAAWFVSKEHPSLDGA
ncbi:MAG: ferritin family protein [Dehalococcoidales bacterium]|nr:ferritin family protein [Dehalococcoidales bacterium]